MADEYFYDYTQGKYVKKAKPFEEEQWEEWYKQHPTVSPPSGWTPPPPVAIAEPKPTAPSAVAPSGFIETSTGWRITPDLQTYVAPTGQRFTLPEVQTRFGEIGVEGLVYDFGQDMFVPATKQQVAEREEQYIRLWAEDMPLPKRMEELPQTIEDFNRMIAEEQARIEAIFRTVFPGTTTQDFRNMLTEMSMSEEALGEFISTLQDIGRTPETELLLQTLFPEATREEIESLFAPAMTRILPELREALPKVVKPTTEKWAVQYFTDNPEALRYELIAEGRNEKTEQLVRQLYPDIDQQQLSDYFSIDALAVEKEAERAKGGLLGTFTAGVGDLIANLGGGFKWMGKEGIGEKLTKIGQFMQVQAEPVPFEAEAFTWKQMFNPQFYATYGVRMMPTLMALAVPGLGAYGLAGRVAIGIAGRVGLGVFGTKVLTAIGAGIGGAALSRPIESALEAGAAYDEARRAGLSHEDAERAASTVFKSNLTLVGLDAMQIAAAFMPTPLGKSATGAVTRGLVRTGQIGGKLFFTGLTEGGEEVYQEMIQKKALGDERGFMEMIRDPDMQLVFSLGAIAGIGMGAGADIIVRIQDKIKPQFTPEQSEVFETQKSRYAYEGFDEDVANFKAMEDTVAQFPQLEKTVEDATKAVEQEITFEQIKPSDKAEEVAFEHMKEQVIPEAPRMTRQEEELIKRDIADLESKLPTAPVEEREAIQRRIDTLKADLERGEALMGVAPEVTPVTPEVTIERLFSEASKVGAKVEAFEITSAERKAGYRFKVIASDGREFPVRNNAEGLQRIQELAIPKARPAITEAEEVGLRVSQMEAEAAGLREWLTTEPVTKLVNLIKKTGWYKGEVKNLTLKQYRDLTGKTEILPNILTADKKHVKWEYALDDIATEMGYESSDALKEAIERAGEARGRIAELEAELRVTEMPMLSTPPETTLPMPDNVNVSEDRVVRPPPPPKEPPPPEPPIIHPPQPAPIEEGKLVMADLQPAQQVVDLYSKPDFWRRVANLPLVKKAVGLFNPAAVAKDPAQQAIILRVALKDEAAQKAQAVMSHVWEIGTQERVWGKTDEMGLLTKEPFVGISIDDIRQNPGKYTRHMTAQQREWIKRAEEIEQAKLNALKRNEIEINELSFEDGGRYAGRRVMGKFNDSGELIESGRIGVSGRAGAKQAFEKTRIFKEASDGITAGFRYMNSDEALYYNTLGAYYKIADKQMAEWVLTKVDWRTTAAPETLVLQAEAARLRLRKAQQLLGALNRAVRGERVPGNTINSIASVYPDQADTLKTLIPELQKPSPETAETVRILDSEAKALISEARMEYAQAVDKRARAREEALRVKYEEASIAHPAFRGKIFTGAEAKEIAETLRKGLQPQFIEALGAVNKANAIGRFFMLAGDASPMAIQLQFLAFYRPKAYVKTWAGFIRAMFDPEFQYRYYANHRDLINRHPTLILSGRGTEFTEFMGRGGLGKKLGVIAKPLVPFQKAFEGSLDVAGIELAKSLDHLCTTPERTLDVDQFINEFRGMTSSARIGVSSTQRQVETAIILAPRYNRAMAGYIFDIANGGLRGNLARQSLAQGFAGLAAMAIAVSIALGEDEDEIVEHFNPTSNKFFTWDVMGVKIGLGGKVRSVLKTFGNMVRTGEVGQPALNFLKGNLAPGIRTALDLITGKNFLGEPTRDNVIDFSKTILRNFMMIWTQNFLEEGGTLQEKAVIATAEFFGLRGYDISAKKEVKIGDLVDVLGQQIGKTPVLTTKKPDIYDTRNIFANIKRILQYTPPEEVLADKGYAPWGHLVVRIQQSEANNLPDKTLKDYNFDPTKGDTLDDYIKQWEEREKLGADGKKAEYTRREIVEGKEKFTEFKGEEALKAHEKDYPNAHLGNLTRRQTELLNEYAVATDKKQFIKDHPELSENPQSEWFKSHPQENAEFAIFGQAKIFSKQAYDEFNRLVKQLDIPDAAIPELTLPPKESVEAYFERNDIVDKWGANSWEDKLLRAKNPELNEWLGLEPIETPLQALELKIKHRNLYEQYDGLTTDEERAKLKADNPEWVDDMRRIEAIEHDAPVTYDEKWVERGRLVDEFSANSSEVKWWLWNNRGVWEWAREQELLTDDGSDWPYIKVIEINVKWRKQDKAYEAFTTDDEREAYLTKNLPYFKARKTRDAYSIEEFPENQINTYVEWHTDSKLKRPTGMDEGAPWYEDDWWLMGHPEFHDAMVKTGQWKQKRDFLKVPSREVFRLYQIYQNLASTQAKLDFRARQPELDQWGQLAFGWKPIEDRGSASSNIGRFLEMSKEATEIQERLSRLLEGKE